MPELMRTIASRLREIVGNRRRAQRFKACLPVAVSLLDSRPRAHPSALEGETLDVSSSGLALVLPAVRIGDRYLTGDSHPLRVTLKLPEATINLNATPVRYEQLERDGEKIGYLVGVQITEMTDQDRPLFDEYLATLR